MFWRKMSFILICSFCLISLIMPTQSKSADASSNFKNLHLIVSIEWQPSQQDTFRESTGSTCTTFTQASLQDMLTVALKETSQALYQTTKGEVWIGQYSVYTNGEHWNDADIRILANNDYRPTAFLGGFENSIRTVDTHAGKAHFTPAAIMLGRLWNGINAQCGLWSKLQGIQTLNHELGHHILGLHDGYAPDAASANYTYCSSTSNDLSAESPRNLLLNDSLMSYHYRANKLRGAAANAYHCDNTPQTLMYALDDWKTVEMLYGLTESSKPPVFEQSDPEAVVNYNPANVSGTTSMVQYSGNIEGEALTFSVKGTWDNPQQLINQGTLAPNQAEPWYGINTTNKDQALIIGRNWHTNSVQSILSNQSMLTASNNFVLTNQRWVADLRIKPVLNSASALPEVNAIEVRGQECGVHGRKVTLAFCPAGGNCRTIAGIDISSTGSFGATFRLTPDEISGLASHHNYIYAYSSEYQTPVATWYQIAGGFGPATAEIHAPLADGNIGLNLQTATSVELTGMTLEVYQPAPLCTYVGNMPNYTIKQWPTLVQPYIMRDRRLTAWGATAPPLYAQLSYDPSLYSGSPVVLVYNPAIPTAGWSVVPIVALSPELGYVTVDLRTYTGQGLIYALGE